MGLAEDLKALQELRDKGELSESDYATARDAALGKQVSSAKAAPIISKPTKVFLAVVILFVGLGIFIRIYVNATAGEGRSSGSDLFHQSLTITDEVENVPAASWKALNYNFPSGGKLDITISVVNGNPIDIYLTPANDLDSMKKGDWGKIKTYGNFNATKAREYHRTAQMGAGSYCLVLRDTSLGVLSAHASDVSVKTILTP